LEIRLISRSPIYFQGLGKLGVKITTEQTTGVRRLFFHFLRRELELSGEAHRLEEPQEGQRTWLPASFVARLARGNWPGNVRELENITRQLVISNRGLAKFRIDATLKRLLHQQEKESENVIDPKSLSHTKTKRARVELTDQTINDVLARNDYNFNKTAAELGVSRTWLNERIEQCAMIGKAKDLDKEEIRRCLREYNGDTAAMASHLRVSSRGLLFVCRFGFGTRDRFNRALDRVRRLACPAFSTHIRELSVCDFGQVSSG
jgi:two-component system nitrogen regulation response regulator GlnG